MIFIVFVRVQKIYLILVPVYYFKEYKYFFNLYLDVARISGWFCILESSQDYSL